MTLDPFGTFAPTPDDPFSHAVEVPASKAFALPVVSRAVLVNSWAEFPQPVRVTMAGGDVVTLMLMPGILHKLRITHIHAFPGPQNNPVILDGLAADDPTAKASGIVVLW